MTFFLTDPKAAPAPRGPDLPMTGLSEGIGAATSQMMRDTNANFLRQREVIAERDKTAGPVAARLGMDRMRKLLEERNQKATAAGMPEQVVEIPDDPVKAAELLGPNGSKAILEIAREAAAADPENWSDLDLSDEGVEKRVTERRKIEDRDESAILAMMPGGRVVAELVGGMAGAVADVRQIPFLLMGGGGGSVLRTMGREALMNGTAEALTLPSQFEVARELEKEAPNAVQQIAIGAAAGAVLGGLFEGAVRGWDYFNGRQALPADVPDPIIAEAAINAAEDAIVAGDNPLRAVRAVLRAEPMVLTPEMRADVAEPVREPLIPEDPPEAAPTAPVEPDLGTSTAVEQAPRPAAPKGKKPADLSTFVIRQGGIWKGDDKGEIAAMQYKRPGFIKKTKLERSTAGDNGGGLTVDEMRERAVEAGYLPEGATLNDFLDALDNDVRGQKTYAQDSLADAIRYEESVKASRMDPEYADEITQYKAMEPANNGLFIDLNAYQFDDLDWEATLARDFDNWIAARGGIQLLPRERDEIIAQLSKSGGEASDLVERALSRELSDEEKAFLGIGRPVDETASGPESGAFADQGDADASLVGGPETAPGNAPELGAGSERLSIPAFERTSAGQQYLAPGVAPISERARLEAQQSKPMRGGERPMDDGLFDLNARAQMDMFSDPTDPKARPMQEAMIESVRDVIARDGDFQVDLMDGRGTRSASDMVREMDDDAEFSDILDLCGKRRTE